MTKKYREIDINIAFSSGLNNLRKKDIHFKNGGTNAYLETASDLNNTKGIKGYATVIRSQVKKTIRPIARLAFRLLKPVVRPIVLRLRQYISANLQLEIHQLSNAIKQNNNLLGSTLREIRQVQPQISDLAVHLEDIERYSLSETKSVVIPSNHEENLAEKGTRLLIERYLYPGNTFVDIGANIGLYTLAAAGTVTEEKEAFNSLKQLEQSAGENRFSDNSTLALEQMSAHYSLMSLNPSEKSFLKQKKAPIAQIDQIVPGQKVDLIKIDIEKAEPEAISNGISLLQNNPEVALIVKFGSWHLQWFNVFENLKLCYKVINSKTGILENWSREQLERAESLSLFFARQESPAWEKAAL